MNLLHLDYQQLYIWEQVDHGGVSVYHRKIAKDRVDE